MGLRFAHSDNNVMFVRFVNELLNRDVSFGFQATKNNLFFQVFVDDIRLSEYSRASMIYSVIRF